MFLTGTERGRWVTVTHGVSGVLTVTLSFAILIFFGLMTTGLGQPTDALGAPEIVIPQLIDTISSLAVGLFYMITTIIFLFAWWSLYRDDDPPLGLSVMDLGSPRSWLIGIPVGLFLGFGFGLGMEYGIGSFFPFEQLEIVGVNVEPLILIIAPTIAIPIAEEFFFGGIMTPTIAEALGVVSSAIITSLVWVLWHLGSYQSNIEILIVLFCFRLVFTLIILYLESLMPAIVAHIVINILGTLFVI